MDNLIKEAKEALKKGASLTALQNNLNNILDERAKVGLYSDKDIAKYKEKIKNLDKSSCEITFLNAKKIAVLAGITIVTATTSFAVISQVGCGSNDSEVVTDVDDENKENENTVSDSSINSTKEAIETNEEVSANANSDIDYVLPDYLTFNANNMEVAKANISEFINDGLSKGLGTVENKKGKLVSSFTEDNLTKKVESYLMLYLGANINQIDYKVLAELNQEGNLTANQIYETAITTLYEMYDDSYTLMNEKDKLSIENIYADKNDVKYINSIINKIIKYNNAYNNAKLDSEKKEIIKEGIIAKEELLKYMASKKLEVNPLAMDYAFLELEALDNLANGQIITDNEEDIKLYNAIVAECLTEEQIERYGIKEQIKQFSGLGVEESSQNLVSVIRNMFHGLVVDKMDAALAYADNVDKNAETSFNYIVQKIADKILSNFKANPYSSADWIWMVNNNGMTLAEAKAATKPSTKTVIVDNVKPESVPEKDKAKPQVTYTDKNTGEKLTETYVKAKKAAIENASRDIANKWKTVGDINKISSKAVPTNIPGENSNNYSAVYNYWYAITWNDLLDQYKLSVIVTEKENDKQKPTSESVSKDEPTIVDKSDNYNNPTPAPEVTFIPEGGTVVVEEGYLKPDEYTPVDSSNNNNNNVNVEQGTDINEGIMSSSNNNNSNNNVTTEQGKEINEGIMMDSYRSDAINSLKALRDELTSTINNADILGTNTKVR